MKASIAITGLFRQPLVFCTSSALLFFVLYLCLFASLANAQDDPDDTAPPPLKIISKIEKSRLASCKDIKERTKAALELMNARLAAAELLVKANNFGDVLRELGAFTGLLDDQLEYMIRTDNDSGRALDNFKRLEIGLRGFMPRIETIRREVPLNFEPYARNLGKYLRDARSRALEPLFSNTVVREPTKPN